MTAEQSPPYQPPSEHAPISELDTRRRKAPVRSEQVLVRLTPDEKADLLAAAERAHKSPAELLRAAWELLSLMEERVHA